MWIISELFIWFNKKQLSATQTHQFLLPSNRRLHLSSPSCAPLFAPTSEINPHYTFTRLLTYGSCAFRRWPRPQHGMKGTRAGGTRGREARDGRLTDSPASSALLHGCTLKLSADFLHQRLLLRTILKKIQKKLKCNTKVRFSSFFSSSAHLQAVAAAS